MRVIERKNTGCSWNEFSEFNSIESSDSEQHNEGSLGTKGTGGARKKKKGHQRKSVAGRKEFEVAKSAEIQSWLRCEAVTAALRSQYHHLDIMKMRWALRYKKSGKPNARLVIIGCHDPPVASRRGRSRWPPLTISSPSKGGRQERVL